MSSISNLRATDFLNIVEFLTYREQCKLSTTSIKNYNNYYVKWIKHEMFRRISDSEKAMVETQLTKLVRVDDVIQIILKELKKGSLYKNHPIFIHKKFPFYAWKAFELGYLPRSLLVTSLIFHSAYQESQSEKGDRPLIHASLFKDDGSKSSSLYDVLKRTVKSRDGFLPFCTEEQLNVFYKEMEKKPLCENSFFLLPKGKKYNDSVAYKLSNIGITLLLDPDRTKQYRIIPSYTMMQTMLNVLYPINTVHMNPVFGLSSGKDLKRNGLDGYRDMLLDFPYVTHPMEADGFYAPPVDFVYHEFYHALLASSIPKAHRVLFINLALYLSNQKLEIFIRSLVDMELFPYRTDMRSDLSDDALFWKATAKTITRLPIDKRLTTVEKVIDFLLVKEQGKKADVTLKGLKEAVDKMDLTEEIDGAAKIYIILIQLKNYAEKILEVSKKKDGEEEDSVIPFILFLMPKS